MAWMKRDDKLGLERHGRAWFDRPAPVTPAAAPHVTEAAPPAPGDSYGVVYRPLRCPMCRSKRVKTYHTGKAEPITRYHRCVECRFNFKSIEA